MIFSIFLLAGCFGLWCGCCQIYNMAEDLGESGLLYVALTCLTPCIPIFLLRGKAREQYDIQGEYDMIRVENIEDIMSLVFQETPPMTP